MAQSFAMRLQEAKRQLKNHLLSEVADEVNARREEKGNWCGGVWQVDTNLICLQRWTVRDLSPREWGGLSMSVLAEMDIIFEEYALIDVV